MFWNLRKLLGSSFDRFGLPHGPIGRAYLEPRKTPHGNVLAELADFLRDEFLDADGLILDEWLLQQADLFVEFRHLAVDDLLNDRGRLAGRGSLRAIDFLLPFQILGG